MVLDVRFLPNPYYISELRELTGNDAPIENYVCEKEVTKEFLSRLYSLLEFLLPQYKEEGKVSLNIAVGCTGGKHRSVVVANKIDLATDEQLDRLEKYMAEHGYKLYRMCAPIVEGTQEVINAVAAKLPDDDSRGSVCDT